MNQPTAQAEQTPAPEAPPKQTLEDLYDQYDVPVQPSVGETPAAEPTAEPAVPATDDNAAILSKLAKLEAENAANRAEALRRTEDADLNRAVDFLEREAELKDKKPILKGFLIAKASEDQRLRALWNSRAEKPKAWRQALEILADEARQIFAVANPQLEENQRAMDESQRAQSTSAPPAEKPEDKVMGMKDPEFDHFWAKLTGRGF